MATYMIFTRESTSSAEELATYSAKVPPTLAGRPMTPHVVYGKHEVLEGPPIEGVVVLEFPTAADAKAWYDSPAYGEAREHRFKGAEYRVVMVEGV